MSRAAAQGLPPARDPARRDGAASSPPRTAPAAPSIAAMAERLPRPVRTARPRRRRSRAPAAPRPVPPHRGRIAASHDPDRPIAAGPRRRVRRRSRPAQRAAPGPRRAAGGRWRIQLGAFSNDANARRAWGGASPAGSPACSPSIVRAGALIRLQAGPLASRAAADRACAAAAPARPASRSRLNRIFAALELAPTRRGMAHGGGQKLEGGSAWRRAGGGGGCAC